MEFINAVDNLDENGLQQLSILMDYWNLQKSGNLKDKLKEMDNFMSRLDQKTQLQFTSDLKKKISNPNIYQNTFFEDFSHLHGIKGSQIMDNVVSISWTPVVGRVERWNGRKTRVSGNMSGYHIKFDNGFTLQLGNERIYAYNPSQPNFSDGLTGWMTSNFNSGLVLSLVGSVPKGGVTFLRQLCESLRKKKADEYVFKLV